MGLAASQARLLTITARLADNELHSQTINNAKMRLATQSAQASDEYVSALNNAQMMFSNIGVDGLTQNQPLTYRALTQYSPYNTQYGIVNSAGQIMVSEEEATIFNENKNNLEGFLKAHGLEWETNFFDENVVGELAPKLTSFYSGNSSYIGDLFNGMTNEDLKNMYLDSLSQETSIEKMNYRKCATNLSGQKEEIYEKTIAPFRKDVLGEGENATTEEQILDYVKYKEKDANGNVTYKNINSAKDLKEYLVNKGSAYTTRKDGTPVKYAPPSGNYNAMDPNVVQPYIKDDIPGTDLKEYYSKVGITWHDLITNSLSDIVTGCRDSITGAGTAGCMNGFDGAEEHSVKKTYNTKEIQVIDGVEKEVNVPHEASYMEVEFPYIGFKFVFGCPKAVETEDPNDINTLTNYIEITNPSGIIYRPDKTKTKIDLNNLGLTSYEDYKAKAKIQNNPFFDEIMKYFSSPEQTDSQGRTRYNEYHILSNKNNDGGDWIYIIPITVGVDPSDVYADVTQQYLDALLGTEGYMDLLKYAENNQDKVADNGEFKEAYNDFLRYYDITQSAFDLDHDVKSMLDFAEFIKLTNGTTEKGLALKDITMSNATPAMKSVLGAYMTDRMRDVLGEPKFSWADKNDPNNTGNADTKAQWYTNLFNRMQKGFKVLENGLAKSQEWLEYAFESGLVTMEQVDLSYNWNTLDYKSCSNIYEETDNSQIVSKAEAKYNRAMNDIKQKDSMFDLQLKNIDTEHQSLQTEYDVIKNVMNKNIERTMKFDQNG